MALLSIKQVAEKYNKTPTQVRYAISQGRLKCSKIGWIWYIDEEDLPDKWPMTPREKLKHERSMKNSE